MAKKKKNKIDKRPPKKSEPQPVSSGDLMDDIDRFEHFIAGYWRQIVYGSVILVVAVAAVAAYLSVQTARRNRIESAIAEAKEVGELENVIKTHPTFPLINSARMRLANAYVEKKEYDEAIKELENLIGAGAEDELLWRAELNIAYGLELKGDKKAAAAKFAAIGADSAFPAEIRAEANYGAARLKARLGDLVKAKDLLETVSKKDENHARFWRDQSILLLNRLKTDPASLN